MTNKIEELKNKLKVNQFISAEELVEIFEDLQSQINDLMGIHNVRLNNLENYNESHDLDELMSRIVILENKVKNINPVWNVKEEDKQKKCLSDEKTDLANLQNANGRVFVKVCVKCLRKHVGISGDFYCSICNIKLTDVPYLPEKIKELLNNGELGIIQSNETPKIDLNNLEVGVWYCFKGDFENNNIIRNYVGYFTAQDEKQVYFSNCMEIQQLRDYPALRGFLKEKFLDPIIKLT